MRGQRRTLKELEEREIELFGQDESTDGYYSQLISAGCYNEHTEAEILDVNACYNTVKLAKTALKNGRSLRPVLQKNRQQAVTRHLC